VFVQYQAVEVVALDNTTERALMLPSHSGTRPPRLGDTGTIVDIPGPGTFTVEGFENKQTIWLADFREFELAPVGPVNFSVEYVARLNGRTYVFARLLGSKTFSVVTPSKLAGAAVDPFLEIPRRLDSSGAPVLDVFAFRLTHDDDAGRFVSGKEVQLTTF